MYHILLLPELKTALSGLSVPSLHFNILDSSLNRVPLALEFQILPYKLDIPVVSFSLFLSLDFLVLFHFIKNNNIIFTTYLLQLWEVMLV